LLEFDISSDTQLTVHAGEPLRSMYMLSPFVWRVQDGYEILIRAVNHSDVAAEKVARIYHARSADGFIFDADSVPAIAPGPDAYDRDGCEDPTVVVLGETIYVYYSGWNQAQRRGELAVASGPDCHNLTKLGVALASTPQCKNPKEATVVRSRDGRWLMFFEFAADDASKIGMASSGHVAGPWNVGAIPFDARPGKWDEWHLSTGPIVTGPEDCPLMFYNGATRDVKWRIGWVLFDASYRRVIARGEDPVLSPPPTTGDKTDIAFAASATRIGDDIRLYYSISDLEMRCAILRFRFK